MNGFFDVLKVQRWDDHRYYHHSLVNQSLHLVSATSFLIAYLCCAWDTAIAAIIAWTISMTSRQAGHFFFEPKGYDKVNHATHAYKEEIKVGYNLRRKAVLLAIWAASPLALYVDPTLFGFFPANPTPAEFIHRIGAIWFLIGIGGLFFRTVQLFVIRDVQTGLVWFTKIVTDPFHDIKLYHKAPLELWRRARAEDDEEDESDEELALDHRG